MFQIKQDLNLRVFNMIIGINQSRTLTKHISCKFECKFGGKKCNSNEKWNNNKCRCESKNPNIENIECVKKVIFGILQHVAAKMVHM